MEAITSGMQGPAVEDVQARLTRLGYTIDATELEAQEFGPATAKAVQEFRANMQLDAGDTVDTACWSALVDASYALGDRTLYLRLPNFHGADVMELQHALNTLGFSCGRADGSFGPHTEAALQQFQENVGLFADGMAFQDTGCATCGRANRPSWTPRSAPVSRAQQACSSATESPSWAWTPSHATSRRACGTSQLRRQTAAACSCATAKRPTTSI